MGQNTVQTVATEYLCASCGACSLVCPVHAIQYTETVGGYLLPSIDAQSCTRCGKCFQVCPGIHFGKALTARLPDDPFVGNSRNCFIGKAADRDIFRNSQSGGVVTTLLLDALRDGLIDAALVTVTEPGPQPRPAASLATTEEEIVAAQKSKYSPVALLQGLDQVRSSGLNIGIVGLPCHLHGLYNVFDAWPSLVDRIKFKIGLVCDRLMTAAAIDYLISLANTEDKAQMLYFRDKAAGGYPGSVRVLGKKGSDTVLPASSRLNIKDIFTPPRCRLCFDKMNFSADVTVGDPWGISDADTIDGESVVVCRTQTGSHLVERAIENKALVLRTLECSEIVEGQRIDDRRRKWKEYCTTWRQMGYALPEFPTRLSGQLHSSQGNAIRRSELQNALALDDFPSRDALLQNTRRILHRKRIKQKILYPIRLARAVLRRFFRLIKRGQNAD